MTDAQQRLLPHHRTLSGQPARLALKQHIGVLGALALATLAIATSLGWPILRQTESAQVAEAERLLDRAAAQLAVRYDYLRSSFEATSETSTPTRE